MIWQLHCCLTSLCVCRQINSYQPPSGYLSITRSASGRSARDLRRQLTAGSALSPKSCLPSATGLGTFGYCQKLRVLFGGPSLHSSVRLRRTRHSGQKSRLCADRSGVPLLYNHACLYRSLPHPEGKAKRLSRISSIRHRHLAGRGAGGEAPCSLRKERNPGSRNLYTAFITIESAGSTCPYHFLLC